MLEDDLQLSSDEDDSITQSASRVTKGSSGDRQQRIHSGRARRSNSSSSGSSSASPSSGSASSSDSDSSTQRSRSPSPEAHSSPEPPTTTLPQYSCRTEETEHSSSAQWHLDKWLKRDDGRRASSSQELGSEAEPPCNLSLESCQSPGGSQWGDHSPPTTSLCQSQEVQRRGWVRESDDEGEKKEKRRKEKGKRREKLSESLALQPKQRPHSSSQSHQESQSTDFGKKKKKKRKTKESKTHIIDAKPSPSPSPPPKPVIFSTDSSSESDHEAKPPRTPSQSPSQSPSPISQRPKAKFWERESKVDGQKKELVTERKEGRGRAEEVQRYRQIKESDDEEKRKEKRRKEKGKGREKPSELLALQLKQRPYSNSQKHQVESRTANREKKKSKTKESKTSIIDAKPSPSPSPPPKPVIPSTDSSSESDDDPKPRSTVAKALADSTSSLDPRGQQKRAGRPPSARPSSDAPSGQAKETRAEEQQRQGRYKLYTLVPFGRSRVFPHLAASSSSLFARARSLRSLLVRVECGPAPNEPVVASLPRDRSSSSSSSFSPSPVKARKRGVVKSPGSPESEKKRKRKSENGDLNKESKRNHAPAKPPLSRATSFDKRPLEACSEARPNGHKEDHPGSEKRVRLPTSPVSDPAEHPKKGVTPQPPSRMREGNTSAQNRQTEVQRTHQKGLPQLACDSRGSPPNQALCQRVTPPKRDAGHEVEHYLYEARRLKRRADTMADMFGKALTYVDAALSYMECGRAIEEGPEGAKSPYSMYAETVELIKYAMRLKSSGGSRVGQQEKQLDVLSFRCLALLHWRMFRLKKDQTIRQSKALQDYFKTSPSLPLTPPPWTAWGKSTGAPSFTSPPSPPLGSSSVLISIPNRIHQMAVDHLDVMNSALNSFEYWEVADNLAKENKEFFSYLSTRLGPLSLNSSMPHIVQYTRQALQWIRSSAHLS
ncbi:AF4/FMR2 family member 3 [Megalops cyprinoides]|uniref:AF4/FMR2 family member 3 n=1 Tax=Megalops cyprinoides TaxID=118141 RepID=UPI001864665E|nr:AF4/FMR2 family member 3 [Megalops cyprinoides]